MRLWLKELRKRRGLTQKTAAEMLEIAPTYYCMIENGERQAKSLTVEMARKIAEVFDVTIEYVFAAESK